MEALQSAGVWSALELYPESGAGGRIRDEKPKEKTHAPRHWIRCPLRCAGAPAGLGLRGAAAALSAVDVPAVSRCPLSGARPLRMQLGDPSGDPGPWELWSTAHSCPREAPQPTVWSVRLGAARRCDGLGRSIGAWAWHSGSAPPGPGRCLWSSASASAPVAQCCFRFRCRPCRSAEHRQQLYFFCSRLIVRCINRLYVAVHGSLSRTSNIPPPAARRLRARSSVGGSSHAAEVAEHARPSPTRDRPTAPSPSSAELRRAAPLSTA